MTSTTGDTSAAAMANETREPCGAVLVCGAGTAGIHASLDLSAAGFRVYLVEEGPGIHGDVAQCDKSAPTGERAACVAFPKLLECERDPNVDVLATSTVTALEGEPGNLKATVRQLPRSIGDENADVSGEQRVEVFDLEIGAVLLTERGRESFPSPAESVQSGDQLADETSGPVFLVQESEDVADTVAQASAAAARAMILLAEARGSLIRKRTYPPPRDVTDEPPRIGVFVCHCGTEISSVVDVEAVVERARQLPNVALAESNVHTCAGVGQDRIVEAVTEHRLNRVVIAGCSPHTHESIFRDTLRCAGLNPHLLEIANIRDQCARVHADRPKQATEKALDLVRMGIGRAAHLVPVAEQTVPVKRMALVIGGGMAGMTCALALADQGFLVRLVEKTSRLGGPAPKIDGVDGEALLAETIKRVEAHLRIRVYLEAAVSKIVGRIGQFTTSITRGSQMHEVKHGVVVVATGTAAQTQRADREELARLLRVPLNTDSFFVQADPELRPIDSVRDGVFLCDVPDAAKSIAQANAAATRAAAILSHKEIPVGGMTASVDPRKCISCMTCVHVCPFMAPQVGEHNKSEVQTEVCMGCGTCSAECPAKAITLQNYVDDQILGAIDNLLAPDRQEQEVALTFPEQVGVARPRWNRG